MAGEPTGSAGADLDAFARVHVVAAGGAGMSAIARILVESGLEVSGSDEADGPRLRALAELGVRTAVGHSADAVEGADALVVSTAVGDDNVEVRSALERGIPVFRRREFLPLLAGRQPLLSVSGTHGKTTTSSMLAVGLAGAGVEVSWLIGAEVPALGAAAAHRDGPYLVLEADESDGSFLAAPRAGAMVTNLEADHLEFWGDWAALQEAFVEFVEGTDGPVVVCADDPGSAALARAATDGRVRTYGASVESDHRLTELRETPQGSSFTLASRGGSSEHRVSLAMPGAHNALNAAGALALIAELGHDVDRAAEALGSHTGVHRRFEKLGEACGVTVIDDYAHLPTEVEAALAAARSRTAGRVVAVFQPHRYSRTQALGASFGPSFDSADVVVVTELFAAGEEPRPGVSGRLVHEAVAAAHRGEVIWATDLHEAADAAAGVLRPGDTLVTVGAGNVREAGEAVLRSLEGSSGS